MIKKRRSLKASRIKYLLPSAEKSAAMRAVHSFGNITTEKALESIFRKNQIKGWKAQVEIPGRPDFSFRKQKVAVFVDGCFWHGCPRCFRLPRQNRAFWKAKIEGNRKRDRSVNERLRRLGWKVVRIRECQLKKPERVVGRVAEAIG
jgi:DNA mismatch endonuclease (patch repair protein)